MNSKGTNVLFGLIGTISLAFDSDGILMIDKLDNSKIYIHSLILTKIKEMFKSKEYNKMPSRCLQFTAQVF